MKKFGYFFGWILSGIFLLLFILILSIGKYIPSLPLLIISIITHPIVGKIFKSTGIKILMIFIRVVLVFVLLFSFVILSFFDLADKPLYLSEIVHQKLINIYNHKLQDWPVSYETAMVNTEFGDVFVMKSGPAEAPPLLLLHAASMDSWSWKYNVDSLSRHNRIFAIDFIGEPGKSRLKDFNHLPQDGKALSELYTDITEQLGIMNQYSIVAASFGGYIALSHAIHVSGRVDKIILLGPMGITPATSSVNTKLILYSLFPFSIFQDDMRH